MFKKQKETMLNYVKKSMSHWPENVNTEVEIMKKNQVKKNFN
jgi:hypothetical protein